MDDARRLFAEELSSRRAEAGLSLAHLAGAAHVHRAYLHRVEHGERWPAEAVARLLDEALGAHGVVLGLWLAGEDEHRAALSDARSVAASVRASQALDAVLDGGPLGEAVTTAEAVAARLAAEYLHSPPSPMLTAALDARQTVVRELQRSTRTAQRRDLVRSAGYLSGVLAYAALDLGHPEAAVDHAATAWRCAESSGDVELRSWVRGTQSLIARFGEDYQSGLALAHDGLRHAGPGTSRPRLLAGVAQSAANLGDRTEAHRALNAAEAAADHAGTDSLPGLFTFSRAKLA